MDDTKFEPALHVGYPEPLGLVRASDVALTVAAPLLTAGALSLIGVVCADAARFHWPGPALLLLVLTVLSLVSSIQLGYQARQYLYSYQDLKDWRGEAPEKKFVESQHKDYVKWLDKTLYAGFAYNFGTVLLLLSVATVLIPKGTGPLAVWRWIAAGLVLVAAMGEVIWSYWIYFPLQATRKDTKGSAKKAKKKTKVEVERTTAP
ncbi:hypothetical protein [Streptomyces sp. NBC_00827]|uniref:hypothetical protein n=1 Tax=Streptomyces sp. NBC_00827 TaxID=2903677 RepID=UPI00386B29EF|nr:hypothetical protein OG569_12970 [Streptomyces sp. NBC_00827]